MVRNRYKTTYSKLFEKPFKRLGILKTKDQVILEPILTSILDRKLLRDLRENWRMLGAICAIIGIGIGCFIGMMSASNNLTLSRDRYYAATRLADIWVDLKKAPVREVERLAQIPGIQEIHTRIQFRILLELPMDLPQKSIGSITTNKPVSALVVSMPDIPRPIINNIIIRTGSYFTGSRPNEVMVGEKFAQARGIVPGDTLTAILNNQRKNLIVVGTAAGSEFIYHPSPGSMVDEPGTYGLIFIKQSFAQDVFGFNSACNSVTALLAPEARPRAREISTALGRKLDSFGVFSAIPRPEQFSPMILDGELTQLKTMAYTLPSFFLGVAALMLNILMQRMAEQQRTIIGTLKSLGYGNLPLMVHFLKFSAAAGLLGGLIGAGLGSWLGHTMTQMYMFYFSFPDLTSQLYPALLGKGILVALIFALAGTLKGVWTVMKLAPAEAMRTAPPPVGGTVFLEKTGLWKRLDAQWQMILRSLIRHRNRSIVAMTASALGASIVLLAFGFVDSMDRMVDLQFQKAMTADFHLTFNRELPLSSLDDIRRLPGVLTAEPVFHLAGTFTNGNYSKKGGIMGILGQGTLTRPLDTDGEPLPLPDTGLLMSRRLMDQLHVLPGDFIFLTPVKGDRTPRQLVVRQGISSMMGLAVYGDLLWLSKALGQAPAINEIRVSTQWVSTQWVSTRQVDNQHTSAQKKAFMDQIKAMPGLETLSDLGEQKTALEKQLNGAMRVSAMIMILFAGIIFFGAILNNTLVAISQRGREIATFRTMGYFHSEVAQIFLRENLITGITGAMAGLVLGHVMLFSAMKSMATDAFSFPPFLKPWSYIFTLGLSIIFIFLTQAVVNRI